MRRGVTRNLFPQSPPPPDVSPELTPSPPPALTMPQDDLSGGSCGDNLSSKRWSVNSPHETCEGKHAPTEGLARPSANQPPSFTHLTSVTEPANKYCTSARLVPGLLQTTRREGQQKEPGEDKGHKCQMMEGSHSEATCQPGALGHTPIPLRASGSPRVTWVC